MVNDNRGITLVELIVSFTVGTIIASAIAGLITFSLRMYRNESVKTSLQYELQNTLNMIMDEAMGSSGMVVNNTGDTTNYVAFGDFAENDFDGVIFVSDLSSNCLYMDRISANVVSASGNSIADKVNTIISASESDKKQYLLGEKATKFKITPLVDTANKTYKNPLSVEILLEFQDKGWNARLIDKAVNDTADMRNYITQPIYYYIDVTNPDDATVAAAAQYTMVR